MTANNQDSASKRAVRKRIAARLRQQRCRARKRAALMASKMGLSQPGDAVPSTKSQGPAPQPTKGAHPTTGPGKVPGYPLVHPSEYKYAPRPTYGGHAPHMHVTASYDSRMPPNYNVPPPYMHYPMRGHPMSHYPVPRTVSEEEKSLTSSPSKSVTEESRPTPLVNKERAAVEAMLALGFADVTKVSPERPSVVYTNVGKAPALPPSVQSV